MEIVSEQRPFACSEGHRLTRSATSDPFTSYDDSPKGAIGRSDEISTINLAELIIYQRSCGDSDLERSTQAAESSGAMDSTVDTRRTEGIVRATKGVSSYKYPSGVVGSTHESSASTWKPSECHVV